MDNLRWIKIIDKKKKLDPERVITLIDEELSAYLVEGINTETSADEYLLVYDCSSHSDEHPIVIISGKDIVEILYSAGIVSVELLEDWLSTNF